MNSSEDHSELMPQTADRLLCLDRNNPEVQMAIESEWSLPQPDRHLTNFSFGQLLEVRNFGEYDSWCWIVTAAGEDLWLPASWLVPAEFGSENLVVAIAHVSALLPVASRIAIAGQPFDLKIFPLGNSSDHAVP